MQLDNPQDEIVQSTILADMFNVESHVALRVLRKHRGDAQKAADALLNNDRGQEDPSEPKHRTTPEPMYNTSMAGSTPMIIPTMTPTAVIDLTAGEGDEEELQRALQLSMAHSSQGSTPRFERSDRAPHPEWQMVRSNDPVGSTATQEDQTLKEAIQASLQDFNEETDIHPFIGSVREGGRPIALRPKTPSLAYGALVLQALYFVPHVRAAVSNLRLPVSDPELPLHHPDRAMCNLIELFTNMDLAQLSVIIDAEVLPSLNVEPFNESRLPLTESSASVVRGVAHLIEEHMKAQSEEGDEPDGLFTFLYGRIHIRDPLPLTKSFPRNTGNLVSIEYGGDNVPNDLVSCLSEMLTKYTDVGVYCDTIVTPSDVVVFTLKRRQNFSSDSKASLDPFGYPKTMYFDRFLLKNLALASEKRTKENEMLHEIKSLMELKTSLTTSNNRDTLQDLRSTIHYYEHVAEVGDDPDRKRTLQRTTDHLKDILTVIMGKVEDIDHRIEQLQGQVATVYDCPELQQCQYNLRAVLVHTGLPGRNNMYSYVQDIEGVWWKTVDTAVSEVAEETVFNDPAGLHLDAGPYMLFYSRHLSEELLREPLIWPSIFSDSVNENNTKFLAMIHPELEVFSKKSPDGATPQFYPPERRATHSREHSMMTVDMGPE